MFYFQQNNILELYLACDDPEPITDFASLKIDPSTLHKDSAHEQKIKEDLAAMGFTQEDIQKAANAGYLKDKQFAVEYLSK